MEERFLSMKSKGYEVGKALAMLNKSNNVSADQSRKMITITGDEKSNAGLKVLGAVDFLVNHCGYRLSISDKRG